MSRWYAFFYALIWPFFNLFHPCRAIGRENIPAGGALVCANHTHASDPFFVVFALRREHRIQIMAKAELLRIPVLGWLLKKVGVFGVERGKSDMNAIRESMRCLKGGGKLLLFPEGTRVREGESVAAKTGAAMLALRTGVPILPMYLPAKRKWFGRTPVVIGEPFLPQAAGPKAGQEDYERVTAQLMERIAALEVLAK